MSQKYILRIIKSSEFSLWLIEKFTAFLALAGILPLTDDLVFVD